MGGGGETYPEAIVKDNLTLNREEDGEPKPCDEGVIEQGIQKCYLARDNLRELAIVSRTRKSFASVSAPYTCDAHN
jgi:hypothetical protein